MSGLGIIGAALAAGLSGGAEGAYKGTLHDMDEESKLKEIQAQSDAQIATHKANFEFDQQASEAFRKRKMAEIGVLQSNISDQIANRAVPSTLSGGADADGNVVNPTGGVIGDAMNPPTAVGGPTGTMQSLIDNIDDPAEKAKAQAALDAQKKSDASNPEFKAKVKAAAMMDPNVLATSYAQWGDTEGAYKVLAGMGAEQRGQAMLDKVQALAPFMQALSSAKANLTKAQADALDSKIALGNKDPADLVNAKWLLETGVAKTPAEAWDKAHSTKDKSGLTVIPNAMGDGATVTDNETGSITTYKKDSKGNIVATVLKPPSKRDILPVPKVPTADNLFPPKK